MRRLEYTRKVRNSAAHLKSPTDAMMVLAHFARERQRLEQERGALEKRIRRIHERLSEIAGTETRLAPIARLGLSRIGAPDGPSGVVLAPGVAELTLQY